MRRSPLALRLPPVWRLTIPNHFAYVALFTWPLVCVFLFMWLPLEKAAVWSLLGGYLLLPSATEVKIALLPPIDKVTIPAVSTLVLCWMKGAGRPPPHRSKLMYLLVATFVVSPIFTSFTNSYELQVGGRSIPGYYPLDGMKFAANNLVTLAPFFIGVRYLSTDRARALLLRSVPTALLLYSIPMLFELRMSPQLHRIVYGFFPHSFAQQVRDNGFRPVVFLHHGIEVAFFTALAVIAAAVGTRAKWHLLRLPGGVATGYLGVILLLCKTLGAALYAVLIVPTVLFCSPRTWVRIALAMALLVCAYPALRNHDFIPVGHVAALSNSISADRSSSFQWRVKNEDMLLAKANEKPILGWGTWGRNRVYDQSGEDVSITDGEWIIRFGSLGWVGYLAMFGLFASCIYRARLAVRGPESEATLVTGGMTLLLGVNIVDLIPNADLLPLTFLLAGSLAGCVRARSSGHEQRPSAIVPQSVAQPALARL